MTLPAGLASIAARLDDCPADRGALAFCRAVADKAETQTRTDSTSDQMLADHAALAIDWGPIFWTRGWWVSRPDGRTEFVRSP